MYHVYRLKSTSCYSLSSPWPLPINFTVMGLGTLNWVNIGTCDLLRQHGKCNKSYISPALVHWDEFDSRASPSILNRHGINISDKPTPSLSIDIANMRFYFHCVQLMEYSITVWLVGYLFTFRYKWLYVLFTVL